MDSNISKFNTPVKEMALENIKKMNREILEEIKDKISVLDLKYHHFDNDNGTVTIEGTNTAEMVIIELEIQEKEK